MRIAVMGAGGMGGYLGAKLALGGEDVTLIARGPHLAALRAHGLRVGGVEKLHVPGIGATDTPADVGPVDIVLFCVKLYDTESAAEAIRPLLAGGGTVITVQNGVESAERIDRVVGAGRTLSGAAYFPANIAGPGEIAFLGRVPGKPLIAFGEPGAGSSARARDFAEACAAAGVDAEVFEDTDRMIWEKFCIIAGMSAATGLTRCNAGAVREDPDMRWLLAEAVSETVRVARARGVSLSDDVEERVMGFFDGNPAEGKASQLVDLERGRPLELEGLSGAIVRLGRTLGVPTPVHATVYAGLKPFVGGARGS